MKNLLKKLIPAPLLLFYHRCLAVLAALFYNHPSEKLIVIGVTGTNGKSTTVNMIAKILEEAGYKVGLTSTYNFKIDKREWLNDKKMTMLGRLQLQNFLAKLVKAGCQYAVIETSSEGIKQSRHLGINYDIAVFTNLTPEHIESHGSFENYKKAKGKLFEHLVKSKRKVLNNKKIEKISVVNLDDKQANYFLQFEPDKIFGYGIEAKNKVPGIEIIKADEIKISAGDTKFKINRTEFNLKLLAKFNIYNSLAAAAACLSMGIEIETIKKALEKIEVVPGRLEFINEGQKFKVLIDYAPESASMRSLYETVKLFDTNKIIHVLGSAGGGRDKSRRPILGQIAAQNADIVIITNEDPYDEEPNKIIDQVAQGAIEGGKVLNQNLFKILDRREAIKLALEKAAINDLILITGKGAEQAMVLKNNKMIKWDDRKAARELLEGLKDKKRICG
jgi:UDP-N-acetylmuramoyl-L-alanyl-D-glutamate--2,6-diaminopimelate ligase